MSEATARQVLAAVERAFDGWFDPSAGPVDRPTLYPAEHEGLRPGCWSIAWEGGCHEWVYLFPYGGETEFGTVIDPVPVPRTVFLEPILGCVLGVYPAVLG